MSYRLPIAPFEIAQKAIDLGFKPTHRLHIDTSKKPKAHYYVVGTGELNGNVLKPFNDQSRKSKSDYFYPSIYAPYNEELVQWLRTEHSVVINVLPEMDKWCVTVSFVTPTGAYLINDLSIHDEHTEATEEGLSIGLKYLEDYERRLR